MISGLSGLSSLITSRSLEQSQRALNKTFNRLSSGLRINRASDDASGLFIADNLQADVRALNQGRRNATAALGITDVADGVLSTATDLLNRAAGLAQQAATDSTSAADRQRLEGEFNDIKATLNKLNTGTSLNGIDIFGRTSEISTGEAGTEPITISTPNIDSSTLQITGNLLTTDSAQTALDQIHSAVDTVSASRGQLGASRNRLQTEIDTLGIRANNAQAAESQIRDADIAEEVVNLTKAQIQTQVQISVLTQANANQKSVLSLLK